MTYITNSKYRKIDNIALHDIEYKNNLLKIIDLRISDYKIYKNKIDSLFNKSELIRHLCDKCLKICQRSFITDEMKLFYKYEVNNLDNKQLLIMKEQIFKLIYLIEDESIRNKYIINFKCISTNEKDIVIRDIYENIYLHTLNTNNKIDRVLEYNSGSEHVYIYQYGAYRRFYSKLQSVGSKKEKDILIEETVNKLLEGYKTLCDINIYNKNFKINKIKEQEDIYRQELLNLDYDFIKKKTNEVINIITNNKSYSTILEYMHDFELYYYDIHIKNIHENNIECLEYYKGSKNYIKEIVKIYKCFTIYSFLENKEIFKEDRQELIDYTNENFFNTYDSILCVYFTGTENDSYIHPEMKKLFKDISIKLFHLEIGYDRSEYYSIENLYDKAKNIYNNQETYQYQLYNCIFDIYEDESYLEDLSSNIVFVDLLNKIDTMIEEIYKFKDSDAYKKSENQYKKLEKNKKSKSTVSDMVNVVKLIPLGIGNLIKRQVLFDMFLNRIVK